MTLVKCPSCGQNTQYEGNKAGPFCSERCKLIDFGAWLDEEYSMPVEVSDLAEEDVEIIEKALENEREN